MRRCFVSVDFSSSLREKMKEIQEKLPEFKGKKTELENIHLTLKFLGEISEKEIRLTREALASIQEKKIKIKISRMGVFSEKFIRIVWLGADKEDEESKGLWELQEEIDKKLGDLFEKERRFMGHITIARIKNIRDKKKFLSELEEIKFEALEFQVEEFKLKCSVLKPEGPVYEDIEIFDLE